MNIIYTLSDPRTGEIRYVGKTTDLKKRLSEHLCKGMKLNTHLGAWIRLLDAVGVVPEIQAIEHVPTNEPWQEVERFWISSLRFLGFRLVNLHHGGFGGGCLSTETKAKIAAANVGKKRPEWACNRMAEAQRGKRRPFRTEAHRRKLSESQKGRVFTDEHRQKLSAAKIGRKIPERSAEHRQKISEFMKRRVVSPETRLRMSLAAKSRSKISSTELATGSDGNSGENKTKV